MINVLALPCSWSCIASINKNRALKKLCESAGSFNAEVAGASTALVADGSYGVEFDPIAAGVLPSFVDFTVVPGCAGDPVLTPDSLENSPDQELDFVPYSPFPDSPQSPPADMPYSGDIQSRSRYAS